jgi:hypothetical protein
MKTKTEAEICQEVADALCPPPPKPEPADDMIDALRYTMRQSFGTPLMRPSDVVKLCSI